MEKNRAIALHHPGPYVKKNLVQAIAYPQKIMYNLKVRKNFMLQKMILSSCLAVVLLKLINNSSSKLQITACIPHHVHVFGYPMKNSIPLSSESGIYH